MKYLLALLAIVVFITWYGASHNPIVLPELDTSTLYTVSKMCPDGISIAEERNGYGDVISLPCPKEELKNFKG